MATYSYEAINAAGKRTKGTVEAANAAEAKGKLLQSGLAVLKLTATAGSAPSAATDKDGQTQTFNWRRFFEKKLPTGDLSLVKNIFSPLYCAMIGAGEESGALPDVLDRLTYIIEHEEMTRQKIASATRYPKMVVAVMAGAFLILLNVVIPQFASLYANSKVALPWPTQAAITLNKLCMEWWWIIALIVAGCVVAYQQFIKTERGILWRDTLSLKIPIIGTVLKKSAIARFAAILSILQRSGISIIDAMSIVSETVNNAFFSRRMEEVKEKIHSGEGVATALTEVGGFSPLALSLITVGENTGSLEEMLTELSKHYDTEVNLAVDELTEWIGPILIIALGAVVLFFALAISLPMWDLVKFV